MLTERLKQAVSLKIRLQGSLPYLFVLEKASGTNNNSVQLDAKPIHLCVLCRVPAFLSVFYSFLLAALDSEKVSPFLCLPCSGKEWL